jgi:hypothetical protein
MKSKREIVLNQIELQSKMQSKGLNLVTCGNCDSVLIHEVNQATIDCFCGNNVHLLDCPDLYYSGLENCKEFEN